MSGKISLSLLQRAESLLQRSKKLKTWQKVVTSLSCVVVFVTTYALILPAITKSTIAPPTENHSEDMVSFAMSFALEENQLDYGEWHRKNANSEELAGESTQPVDISTRFVGDAMAHTGVSAPYLVRGESAEQWYESALAAEGAGSGALFGHAGEAEPSLGDIALVQTADGKLAAGIVAFQTRDRDTDAVDAVNVVRAEGEPGAEPRVVAETFFAEESGQFLCTETGSVLMGYIPLPTENIPAPEPAPEPEPDMLPEQPAEPAVGGSREKLVEFARAFIGNNGFAQWHSENVPVEAPEDEEPTTPDLPDMNVLFVQDALLYAGFQPDYLTDARTADSWSAAAQASGRYLPMTEGEPRVGDIAVMSVLGAEGAAETALGIVTDLQYGENVHIFKVVRQSTVHGEGTILAAATVEEAFGPLEGQWVNAADFSLLVGSIRLPAEAAPQAENPEAAPDKTQASANDCTGEGLDGHLYAQRDGQDVTDEFAFSLEDMPLTTPASLAWRPMTLALPEPPMTLGQSTGGGRIYSVVAKWHEAHDPGVTELVWKDWSSDVTPDAHVRFEIKYNQVKPSALRETELVTSPDGTMTGYALYYEPDELLRGISANGKLLVNDVARGKVYTNADGKIVLLFDKAWVESFTDANETIIGDFFYQAEFDLSKLEENDDRELNIGGIKIQLPDGSDARAQFGELNIDKSLDETIYTVGGKTYLRYTIHVTAGQDKMDNVYLLDTLTAGANILMPESYYWQGYTADTALEQVSDIPDALRTPCELVTAGAAAPGTSSLYKTNATAPVANKDTASEALPPAANGSRMVWNIGTMQAGEERTLAYFVEVNPAYFGVNHQESSRVDNKAELFSKHYPHSFDSERYSKNATARVTKSRGTTTLRSDGKFEIEYTITVTAPTNNEYTMTNVRLYDNINDTNDRWEMYADYMKDSVTVTNNNLAAPKKNYHSSLDGTPADNLLTQTTGTALTGLDYGEIIWDADRTRSEVDDALLDGHDRRNITYTPGFNISVGDLAPGQSATVTYKMTFEAGHEGLGNDVGIANRASVYNDPTKMDINRELNHATTTAIPTGSRWASKSLGGQNTLPFNVSMAGGDVYNLDGSAASNPGSFTVAAGSFKYVVDVNEKGYWNVGGATLHDQLGQVNGNYILEFDNYLQVEELTVDEHGNKTVSRTVWVKIDGETSFNIGPDEHGDSKFGLEPSDGTGTPGVMGKAYRLTYYAVIRDDVEVGTVQVGNRFNMTGTAIGPGGPVYLTGGVWADKSVTAVGDYNFVTSKEFWYYDPDDTEFFYMLDNGEIVRPGALYWVIRVDANRIKSGSILQESVNSYTEFNNLIRKDKSLKGFYVGNIEGLTDRRSDHYLMELYDSLDSVLNAGVLRKVEFDHSIEYTSGNNKVNNVPSGFPVESKGVYGENLSIYGRDKNWDVTVKIQETIALQPNESLYLLVKTEPFLLPDVGTAINQNYKNKCNIWDGTKGSPSGTWPNVQASTRLSTETKGLEKKPQGVYKCKDGNFSVMGDLGTISAAQLQKDIGLHTDPAEFATAGPSTNVQYKDGVYVAWTISVNTLNSLKGRYILEDTLPDGVELVYVKTSDIYGNFNRPIGYGNYIGPDVKLYNGPDDPNDPAHKPLDLTKDSGANYRNLYWAWTVTNRNPDWEAEGWQPTLVVSRTNRAATGRNATGTYYYTKGNSLRIYLHNLLATGNNADNQKGQIDFLVLCRVTDPNINFEDVELWNTAELLNVRGKKIDSDSAVIKAFNGSLSKTDLAGLAGSGKLESSVIPYEIVLNDEFNDMDPDYSAMQVPLVDHMSSNLSMVMDTLRIYATEKGSSTKRLVYSQGKAMVTPEDVTQKLYYAVNSEGVPLYWEQQPIVHTGAAKGERTVYAADAANLFPAVTTTMDGVGVIPGNEYAPATTGANAHGGSGHYFVQSTKASAANHGYQQVTSPQSDLSDLPSGIYHIKHANSGRWLTSTVANGGLTCQNNEASAENWQLTRVPGSGYTLKGLASNKYATVDNSSANVSDSPVNLVLQRVIDNSNKNKVTIANGQSNGIFIADGDNRYGLNQFGGISSNKFAGWDGRDNGSVFFFYLKCDYEAMAANTKLYWDASHATMHTLPTAYPVVTTDPDNAGLDGVTWKPVQCISESGALMGNVTDALQDRDATGKLLYYTDSTKTLVSTTPSAYPKMTTTSIRISVDDYRDNAGNTDGTKAVFIHGLPDNVKLTISYDVTAAVVPNGSNNLSNEAFWQGYEKSEGGNSELAGLTFEAGGTISHEAHGAVRINKYDATDTSKRLQGATFALFRAEYEHATGYTDTNGNDTADAGEITAAKPCYIYVQEENGTFTPISKKEAVARHYPGVYRAKVDGSGNLLPETEDEEIVVVRSPSDGEALLFYEPKNGVVPLLNELTAYQRETYRVDTATLASRTDIRHHLEYDDDEHVLLDAEYNPVTNLPRAYVYDTVAGVEKRVYYDHSGENRIELSASQAHAADKTKHRAPDNKYYQTTYVDNGDPMLNSRVLAIGTTDANGTVAYGLLESDDRIHFNKIYAIVEVGAPAGYDLDRTEHFFVVPSQANSGLQHSYFYHKDNKWPENVHVVVLNEGGTLTYKLDIYDKKAGLQVQKIFGGHTEDDFRPGTYRFGLWDSLNLTGADAGKPSEAMRLDVKTITYTANDFGYMTVTARDGSDNPIAYTAWRRAGSGWQTAAITYQGGAWVEGTWTNTALGNRETPENADYGILPGHVKTATFNSYEKGGAVHGIDFDKPYFIFELNDEDEPIVPNASPNARGCYTLHEFTSAENKPVNGYNYSVTYTDNDVPETKLNSLLPTGDAALTGPEQTAFLAAAKKHSLAAAVLPAVNEAGVFTIPVKQVTNTGYEAQVTKSFADLSGKPLNSGLKGTYTFALYEGKVDSTWHEGFADAVTTYTPDFTHIVQTRTITWETGEQDMVTKSVTFTNLVRGKVYFIYELDADGDPVVDPNLATIISGAEFKADYYNVGYTMTGYTGPKVWKPNGGSQPDKAWENGFVAGFEEWNSAEGEVHVPTIHATNTTAHFALPKTGGRGTGLYTAGGLLLIGSGCLLSILLRRKRERRYS